MSQVDAQCHRGRSPLVISLGPETDEFLVVEDLAGVEPLLSAAFMVGRSDRVDTDGAYRVEPDGDGVVLLRSPHRSEARRMAATEVADALLTEITHLRLISGGGVDLHSGAVDFEGRGVMLVGSSGAGKSTFVAHLLAAGGSLVNDEVVAVDRESELIVGFRRPIAIDADGHRVIGRLTTEQPLTPNGRWLLRPEKLGSAWSLACRPALLLDLRRRAGPMRAERLDPVAAFVLLCANNLNLVADVANGLEAFAWMAATVPCLRLGYDEAGDAVPFVIEATKGGQSPDVTWAVAGPGDELHGSRSWRARLKDDVHSVSIDGNLVLYAAGSRAVVRLDHAAERAWTRLGRRHRPRRRERDFVAQLSELGVGP